MGVPTQWEVDCIKNRMDSRMISVLALCACDLRSRRQGSKTERQLQTSCQPHDLLFYKYAFHSLQQLTHPGLRTQK